jgi:tetratricopeptide (TPR) repeat protein
MHFLVRIRALPALVCGIVALSAVAAPQTPVSTPVKAWQDTVELPTYPEGLPPENPPFSIVRPDPPVYPYTLRSNLGSTPETQTWRVIHLENEFLACSVLPDLGGHVYRCIDKANGRDVFHPALSIKKLPVALRGSWLSTGIEFNFPVSHSWVTVSPVDFHWRQNSDGSASAFVGDIDRVEGSQWLVELILRPGSRVLEQRVTLYNPGEIRQRYSWWANAAVTEESPGTTFVFPTNLMYLDDASKRTVPWPLNADGVDLSRQSNHKTKLGLSAAGSKEPFMAIYNPASKTGVVHYADPIAVPGKKMWTWGADEDPGIRKGLSDNDAIYVELQAGVFPTQSDFDFLEPQQLRRFTEYWMPVHDLDGITRATRDAVLNLQRHDQTVLVQLQANRDIGAARIHLTAGAETLLDEAVNLTTAAVYSKSIPFAGQTQLTLELLDSRGNSIMRHSEGAYDAIKSDKAPMPGVAVDCTTKEGCLTEAINFERIGASARARSSYETALVGFHNPPAGVKGLARLDVMQAHFANAIYGYQRISIDPEPLDPESEYYWGIALHYVGDLVAAPRHWANALKDPTFGPPAQLELAYEQAWGSHWNEALAGLASLDALSRRLTRAGELEVIVLRRAGQKAKAGERLQAWLGIDPTNTVLRNEAALLGKDDPSLWLHLAAEPERVLNMVDTYLRVADYAAALQLLERNYPPVPSNQMEPGAVLPQQHPLIVYYRGYCREMLGRPAEADYAAASHLPVRYVFPSRFSSLEVLRTAIRANPADGTAHYLLGSLEMHFSLLYPALEDLRAAVRDNFREPVVFWNLALALDLLRDPGGALAILRGAQELGPLPPDLQQLSAKLSPKVAPSSTAAALALNTSEPDPFSPPKQKGDPSTLPPDELASFAFDLLAHTEIASATEVLSQDRLKEISSNDLLRQAYFETKLQNVLFIARKKQCDGIDSVVRAATEADSQRPFTKPGGKAVLESPRYLFYLGRAYGLCADVEKAQALWKQAAGKQRDIASPEYVFPLLSRVQLGALHGKPVRPELEKALASVSEKIKTASKDQLPPLNYSAAMLLQALGRMDDAETLFRVALQGDTLLQYTARIGLRDNDLARHGVK